MGNCCSCFKRKNDSESEPAEASGSNHRSRSSSSEQQQQTLHQQVQTANNEPSDLATTVVAEASSRGKHRSASSTSSSSSNIENSEAVQDPSSIPSHADVPSASRMVHSMSVKENGANVEVDARSHISSSRFHDRSSSSSSSSSEKSASSRGPLTDSVMKNVAETRINSAEHSPSTVEVTRALNIGGRRNSGSTGSKSTNEEKVMKPALSASSSSRQNQDASSRTSSRVHSSASNTSTSSSAAEMRGSKSSSSYHNSIDGTENAEVVPMRNIESSDVERSRESSSSSSQKDPKSRDGSGSILDDGSVRVVESTDIDGQEIPPPYVATVNSSSHSSSDVVKYDGTKDASSHSSSDDRSRSADIGIEEEDKENVPPAISSDSASSSSLNAPKFKLGLKMSDRSVQNDVKPVAVVQSPLRTSTDSCDFHSANSGQGEGSETHEVVSSSSSDGPNSSEQTSVTTRPSEVASSVVQTSDGASSSEQPSSSVMSRSTDVASSVHRVDSSMPSESVTSRSFSTKPSTSARASTERSFNRDSSYATSTTRATSYNSSDPTDDTDLL